MASPPTISISDSMPDVGAFTDITEFTDPIASREAAADQYAAEIEAAINLAMDESDIDSIVKGPDGKPVYAREEHFRLVREQITRIVRE